MANFNFGNEFRKELKQEAYSVYTKPNNYRKNNEANYSELALGIEIQAHSKAYEAQIIELKLSLIHI